MSSISTTYAQSNGITNDASTSNSSSKLADMDAFLTLFTTQLQYQDPENPLESHELSAQLASFSTVEQLSNLNETMEEMPTYLSEINNLQMFSLVGMDVTCASDELNVVDGEVSNASYTLDSDAESVLVKIYDENDNLVAQMNLGELDSGSHKVEWDGTKADGTTAVDGSYSFVVEATDASSEAVDVAYTTTGTVHSVAYENGEAILTLNEDNGLQVPYYNILSVTRGDVSQ